MLTLFEKITGELTDYEKRVILPAVIKEIKDKKKRTITNKSIVDKLRNLDIKTTTPRIRKVIHHIRVIGLIPRLIASSSGYYISNSIDELDEYIKSLQQRLNSIRRIKDSLQKQRDSFSVTQNSNPTLF